MNKQKMMIAVFAALTVLSTSALSFSPVRAYTYHGITSDWDYGGQWGWSNSGYNNYLWNTDNGLIYALTVGWGHQDTYLNSGPVDAIANVDDVTVQVYWSNGAIDVDAPIISAELECKLYINGGLAGTQSKYFPNIYSVGYTAFDFDADIDTGDDLDVDLKFIAEAGNSGYPYGEVELTAYFSNVAFITY